MSGDTETRASADAGVQQKSAVARLFRPMTGIPAACALVGVLTLAACGEKNAFVPPPPPKIEVAQPLKKTVTRYLEATGNTAAVNTTTLVARVQGFIQAIKYNDGDLVKAGDVLFVIEQKPYQLSLEQAEAGQASAQADTKKAEADYARQVDLAAKNIASQATLDQATASKDAAIAKQTQSEVDIEQAKLNLSYTEVKAPFDGIVTAREVSLGQLVGAGGPTTLATIVQLNPIYVNFAISETDVQDIRSSMRAQGLTREDMKKIPIEVGLQSEQGYPHKGTLDYAAPTITAATGTLLVRGVLPNENRSLLPGYFVRVRVPRAEQPNMLLVPDRVVGSDQSGRYVLVANKDNDLEQRKVVLGQQVGDLRVIDKGLQPDDRVVISGLMSVIPGQKIDPVAKTIAPPAETAP
ncbi:efflux transporter, RND family, MFP subunit [Hyphomicrobium denitrificans ATCC 51888]|uniref:Efflux transporter, RND family, MFP subunit n=1 Tax=Hyphomicrobium denitrificans (strain ATCC 51888 / DSM 1869 / NCIMB 11706 / TK 0415) TaxID=582899 RepID=D8JQF9_HYPDA|nr:efflux RND transporter periplasmic adaptor subunit [Hyphomicrobium denitrificans]ADJ23913.1 efflux transporter, RND family, MFP subunit [Hyphomicrobium denitrificans ATCC 51888]